MTSKDERMSALERFNNLVTTRNGIAAKLRKEIWKYAVLREPVRASVWLVRRLMTMRSMFRDVHLVALGLGREVGGRLSLSELEAIWQVRRRGRSAMIIGNEPEAHQASVILSTGRMKVDVVDAQDADATLRLRKRRVKVLVVIGDDLSGDWDAQLSKSRSKIAVLRLKGLKQRSRYDEMPPTRRPRSLSDGMKPSQRLAAGQALRVLFLNDVGYQYGAGLALKRQAASFLLKGHEVTVLSWTPGNLKGPPQVVGVEVSGGWIGLRKLGSPHQSWGDVDVVSAVREMHPDLVIVGNLHGASDCIEVVDGLKNSGIHTVCYMHDAFWVTGRCAYPMACSLYQTGCNETCPTADEAPRLAPKKINAAWLARAELFAGTDPIPLITNSNWTRHLVVDRFRERARSRTVYLGVDHELFAPLDREEARRIVGIPNDRRIVVMGAVNINEERKGGPVFLELQRRIMSRSDLGLILFGLGSEGLAATKSFGLVEDERLMPLILACADVFVAAPTAEAFGQTLLEAAACGLPVITRNVGGVPEIVVHGETGLLIDKPSAEEFMHAIMSLLADTELCRRMGDNARKRVVDHFTFERQGEAWEACISELL